MSYSFLFKYIVIGDQSVGKSCLLMQFIDKQFKVESDPTIGVEFGSKTITIKDKPIKLQIWDTAGQEVYKSITRSYYRGTIAAVLVYDITNRTTFNNIQKWIEETRTFASNQKITILLIGNKQDLSNSRHVSFEEGQNLAEKNGMMFLQSSAKTGYNVDNLFQLLSLSILQKIENGQVDAHDEGRGIKIGVAQTMVLNNYRRCC